MIVLPLHGQDTAAVKYVHWAGSTPHMGVTGGDVFVKQAGLFLPSSFLLFLVCAPSWVGGRLVLVYLYNIVFRFILPG